jgi:hypothetical protein
MEPALESAMKWLTVGSALDLPSFSGAETDSRRDEVSRWQAWLTDTSITNLIQFSADDQAATLGWLGAMTSVPVAKASAVAEAIAESPSASKVATEVADKIRSPSTEGLGRGALLLLVIIWLVAVGLPFRVSELKPRDQTVISNELATVGLAIAVTDKLKKRN